MYPILVYRLPNGPKVPPASSWSEEALKIIEKYFITNFDSNNKCTYSDRSCYSCLIKTCFLNIIKSITRSFIMLNSMIENESKTCAFIFHHNIQNDEAMLCYAFYNEIDCPN